MRLKELDSSTAVPSLRRESLKAQPLAIAPTAEQERIVAAIEEQFSRLDAAAGLVKRSRENVVRLRSAAPLAVLRGKPGSEGLGETSNPDAPGGAYPWRSIAEVSSEVVDCEHWTPTYLQAGLPCVDTTCISSGVIHRDRLRFVDPETYQRRIRRLAPARGDVIFAREGTVGTAVVVPSDIRPCLGQRVMLFRPNPAIVDSDYLSIVINSEIVKSQYRRQIVGTTAPHLNVRDAKALQIPLPPLAVQQSVVAAVGRVESNAASLETVLTASVRRVAALRSSILASAFSGRLVPQEPLDEPGTVLLARISAGRESLSNHKAARTSKPKAGRKATA
jgi:type I restriction enzyme S subunit